MLSFDNGWLRGARRALSSDWRRGGVVLLYHRVADLARDPQLLAVSPLHFNQHLEILRREATLLSLDELIEHASTGTLPDRAVAVTFDDGYADTLHAAAPMLAHHGVPATTFVATGRADGCGEFWWDAIERLVLVDTALTVRLTLNDVVEAHQTGPELYRLLCVRMRSMASAERASIFAELRSQVPAPAPRDADRPLSASEVAALAAIDGITIGSHTVSHVSLAAVDRDRQRVEIAGARTQLEAWIGAPVEMFAYPFGGRDDANDDTVEALQSAAVRIACTTLPGRVHRATDPLRVPRLIVRDWDATTFSARLSEWLS